MWRAVPATLSQEKRARAVLTADDVDIVVCDVSLYHSKEIMPHILRLVSPRTTIVAMVKPQFEAVQSRLKHHGVIKNDTMRRSAKRF